MKKQVLFIHGGEAFSSYEQFLTYLRSEEINPYEEKQKRWYRLLPEALGADFEVFTPQMPNAQNAKYEEWKIWFEKYIPYLKDGAQLVGHSQGGYFLARYFAENDVPFRVGGLYLVAAAVKKEDFGGEDGGDFAFDLEKLPLIQDKIDNIVICHSTDDFVVPFTHAEILISALPKAKFMRFEDRNHFLQPDFPELIERMRAT